MRVMEKGRPELLNNPEFRALRGAARLVMGHLPDAAADLYHPSLQNNDEARFWQAVLRAREGDMKGAARFLRHLGAIIQPYPKALKVPLGLLVAEGGIALGSVRTARTFLDLVEAESPKPADRAELGYLAGLLAEMSGDTDSAVSEWEQVQTGPNRPSRARATKARTELLLRKKEMGPQEAIEEFENLRYAWRGDDFEFDVLLRLGELYIDVADFRNGLRTLRQAATHFRTHARAAEVTQKMADSFASLYLDNAADKLAPVTAIALYDEFRELTPPGKRGDLLVRKLAERLVDIDLLDRAAKLLQAQIEFRLVGVEKADAGTELARVHILNRQPEMALQSLKETEFAGLPPELAERRRHLAATALHDLKRTPEALALLKEDKSVGADEMRVEIYWANQDWANTAQALRRLVRASKAEPGQSVDDQQAENILNLATTLTLSGNQRAINRLRKDFGPGMDESPFRDAFRLIAGAQSLGLVDYRTIGGKVAQAENFQGFMAAYRERLKEEQESESLGDNAGG